MIYDCVINKDLQKGYDKALERLYAQFGSRTQLQNRMLKRLGEPILKADSKSLDEFANEMAR